MNDVPSYGEVHGEAVYLLTKGAAHPHPAAADDAQPRQLGRLGLAARPLPRRAGGGGRCRGAAGDGRAEAARRRRPRAGDPHRRQGARPRGKPLATHEPGSDIVAKLTVLAEGTQGHLTGAAISRFGLEGEQPQIWALGVKEVWKVPRPLGHIVHTMGWPLRKSSKYGEFGGSFIYPMGDDMVSLGFVAGLEYRDVEFSVHDVLQEFKTHKLVRKILGDGERIAWGAKTITEGGYHALPTRFNAPGLLLAGESAGLVNVPTLKGIHYAIESGIMAAEAAFRSLQRGESPRASARSTPTTRSCARATSCKDLHEVRNMRQVFDKGFFMGGALASAMTVTKGNLPPKEFQIEPNADGR